MWEHHVVRDLPHCVLDWIWTIYACIVLENAPNYCYKLFVFQLLAYIHEVEVEWLRLRPAKQVALLLAWLDDLFVVRATHAYDLCMYCLSWLYDVYYVMFILWYICYVMLQDILCHLLPLWYDYVMIHEPTRVTQYKLY